MLLARRITLTGTLVVLLLAGCTSRPPDPPPDDGSTQVAAPTPTPSESAEPTPSPTPSADAVAAPVPPAELARTDEAGAAAAATYFLELYPYVLRTGDFTAWNTLSWEQCQFCTDTREYVEAALSTGSRFEGAALDATVVAVHPRDELLGGYPVDVDITQAATVERGPDGAVRASSPEEALASRVDMLYGETGWKVLAVADRAAS